MKTDRSPPGLPTKPRTDGGSDGGDYLKNMIIKVGTSTYAYDPYFPEVEAMEEGEAEGPLLIPSQPKRVRFKTQKPEGGSVQHIERVDEIMDVDTPTTTTKSNSRLSSVHKSKPKRVLAQIRPKRPQATLRPVGHSSSSVSHGSSEEDEDDEEGEDDEEDGMYEDVDAEGEMDDEFVEASARNGKGRLGLKGGKSGTSGERLLMPEDMAKMMSSWDSLESWP